MSRIISIFAQNKLTTGAHKRHIGLLKGLKERGHQVHLFSPKNLFGNSYLTIPEQRESIIPKSMQTLLAIRRKFKDIKQSLSSADIILIFGFGHTFASIYLKKKLKIPLIYAVRGNTYEYRRIRFSHSVDGRNGLIDSFKGNMYLTVLRLLENYVYKKSDRIIVQNQNEYHKLSSDYNLKSNKLQVIANNINFQKPKQPEKYNNSARLRSIIFLGSLNKRKGIILLLEAVNKLIKEDFEVNLEICGKGEMLNSIRKFVQTNNLEHSVKIQGFIADPLTRITKADLMVVPSLLDSFPNSALEALYVGTPVIGSNVGGISEILKDKTLLFEPDNAKAIYHKIKALLDNESYKKCREKCNERRKVFIFDWIGKFEEELLEII